MLRSSGDLQSSRHAFQAMTRPRRVQPACDVQRVTYIRGRTCDPQSCAGHREEAEIKQGLVRQKDGVRYAEEFDEVGDVLFNGGLSSDHRVSDAVHLLEVRGDGRLGIDEGLEGGDLPAS
jgi:hypothetical protein